MNTTEKLNKYAEIQHAHDELAAARAAALAAVITDEIRRAMDDIEAEFQPKMAAVAEKADALVAEIKAEVIGAGQTVKGQEYMAVYSKPRVSWDSKKLDGLMIVLPQLAAARKEGEPSVSVRRTS